MKLSEIQDLIKFVAKSGVCEVELQTKDVKIIIKTKNGNGNGKTPETTVLQAGNAAVVSPAVQVAAPPQIQTSAPAPVASEKKAAEKQAADEASGYLTIKSPMIGTFYRSSSPDKPAFVNVGDEVQEGNPVCIIEAMKLFNEIESDIKGKIVKVLVNDATPVEYDQPLFLVDPN